MRIAKANRIGAALVLLCLGLGMTARAEETEQIRFGQTYAAEWTGEQTEYARSFTLARQGIVTLTVAKPCDERGVCERVEICLLDAAGEGVWGSECRYSVNDSADHYCFSVGLAAGEYTLTMECAAGSIQTEYTLDFRAEAFCELESNDTGADATALEPGNLYTGFFGSDGYHSCEENDYFCFPVTAGHFYRITFDNFGALDTTTSLLTAILPGETDARIDAAMKDNTDENGMHYCDVEAARDGTGYLRLYNYGGAQYSYGLQVEDVSCLYDVHDYEKNVCRECGVALVNENAPVVKGGNVASTGKVKLTWQTVEGAVFYKVYRAESRNGAYKLMKTTEATSYINTSGKAGQTYYYYVTAVDGRGNVTVASNTVMRTCDLPRPVVQVTNVASSGKIKLTWEAVEGAVSYRVYRSESKDGTYKLMKTTTSTSYVNTAAVAGKTYYYKVVAVAEKTAANSACSGVKYRTCDLPRPKVSASCSGTGKPRLTWEAVEGAVCYRVYRAATKNGNYTLMKTVTKTSYTNTSAKSGVTYYYKVVAVAERSAANSAYSAVVSVKAK